MNVGIKDGLEGGRMDKSRLNMDEEIDNRYADEAKDEWMTEGWREG